MKTVEDTNSTTHPWAHRLAWVVKRFYGVETCAPEDVPDCQRYCEALKQLNVREIGK